LSPLIDETRRNAIAKKDIALNSIYRVTYRVIRVYWLIYNLIYWLIILKTLVRLDGHDEITAFFIRFKFRNKIRGEAL
jgi:hypothetical protein